MSSEPINPPSKTPRKRRYRRIVLLFLPLLLSAVAWQVVERVIDVERYRPLIQKELELLLELPLVFGALDLQLLPRPQLVVSDVTLGDGLFKVEAPRVAVTANLVTLLKGRLDLQTVTIHTPRVQFPESGTAFVSAWRDYLSALATPDDTKGTSKLTVTLGEIVAPAIQVYRGENLYAELALTVGAVTDGAPVFQFSGSVLGISGTPHAEGNLSLTVGKDPVLQGQALITGMPLSELTGDDRLPPFLLDGTLKYRLSQTEQFELDATGLIQLDEAIDPLGPFSLMATYNEDGLALQQLQVETESVRFAGELRLPASAGWALTVADAHLVDDGINWLLAFLPELPLRPNLDGTARCVLQNMELGVGPDGVFMLHTGDLQTEGIDLLLGGADVVLTGLRSQVGLANDRYEIREIASDSLSVSGALNFIGNGQLELSLTGQAALGPDFPMPPGLLGIVNLEGGSVRVTNFSTILEAGVPILEKTALAAEFHEGAFSIHTPARGVPIRLLAVEGTVGLSPEDNRVSYTLKGDTSLLGLVEATGAYDLAGAGTADMLVTLAPKAFGQSMLTSAQWTAFGEALLSDFATLAVQTTYVAEEHRISFSANDGMPVSGNLALTPLGGVESLALSVALPAEKLAGVLPDGGSLVGPTLLNLVVKPENALVEATLNLTEATGHWKGLSKPAGFETILSASGQWRGGSLEEVNGQLTLGVTQTPFHYGENGLSSAGLDLNLTDLIPVLPSGTAMAGRVVGTVEGSGSAMTLQFTEASLQPGPELPTLALDGKIYREADTWTFDSVTLSQGEQHARLSLTKVDGSWRGTAQAEALNVDSALSDYGLLLAWWALQQSESAESAVAKTAKSAGEVALSVDALTWGKLAVNDFRSTVLLGATTTEFTDLRFNSGDGHGVGSLILVEKSADAEKHITFDLELKDADLGLVEPLLSEETRNMHGVLNGHVALRVDIPKEDRPLLHGVNGRIDFSASDGTLGKAGLASKLLAALRTTDILRLRIPSFRDEGVTFRTLSGVVNVENGRFTLDPYQMEDETYRLSAHAELDYPNNTASGVMVLQILDGVTSIASKIPILGDAADLVSKAFHVELQISGTAEDPAFRVDKLGALKSLGGGARNLLKGTQKIVTP